MGCCMTCTPIASCGSPPSGIISNCGSFFLGTQMDDGQGKCICCQFHLENDTRMTSLSHSQPRMLVSLLGLHLPIRGFKIARYPRIWSIRRGIGYSALGKNFHWSCQE
ncbi:hypothetical protein EMPG_16116, partial [Blastomyces silverae]